MDRNHGNSEGGEGRVDRPQMLRVTDFAAEAREVQGARLRALQADHHQLSVIRYDARKVYELSELAEKAARHMLARSTQLVAATNHLVRLGNATPEKIARHRLLHTETLQAALHADANMHDAQVGVEEAREGVLVVSAEMAKIRGDESAVTENEAVALQVANTAGTLRETAARLRGEAAAVEVPFRDLEKDADIGRVPPIAELSQALRRERNILKEVIGDADNAIDILGQKTQVIRDMITQYSSFREEANSRAIKLTRDLQFARSSGQAIEQRLTQLEERGRGGTNYYRQWRGIHRQVAARVTELEGGLGEAQRRVELYQQLLERSQQALLRVDASMNDAQMIRNRAEAAQHRISAEIAGMSGNEPRVTEYKGYAVNATKRARYFRRVAIRLRAEADSGDPH